MYLEVPRHPDMCPQSRSYVGYMGTNLGQEAYHDRPQIQAWWGGRGNALSLAHCGSQVLRSTRPVATPVWFPRACSHLLSTWLAGCQSQRAVQTTLSPHLCSPFHSLQLVLCPPAPVPWWPAGSHVLGPLLRSAEQLTFLITGCQRHSPDWQDCGFRGIFTTPQP